jgi:flagellar protein FlaG
MSTDTASLGASARMPPPAATPAAAAPSRQSPSGNVPVGSNATTAAGAAPAVAAPKTVTLRPPEKVDIGFDARDMRRQLEEAIQQLNDQAKRNGRDLNFRIDQAVDRTVITVRSKHNGEVVRQIPSETVLKVAHSIEDMKGLLLNETA